MSDYPEPRSKVSWVKPRNISPVSLAATPPAPVPIQQVPVPTQLEDVDNIEEPTENEIQASIDTYVPPVVDVSQAPVEVPTSEVKPAVLTEVNQVVPAVKSAEAQPAKPLPAKIPDGRLTIVPPLASSGAEPSESAGASKLVVGAGLLGLMFAMM